MTIATAISAAASRLFTSSTSHGFPLPIFQRLRAHQRAVIVSDDRHEPVFHAGDQLVIDTSRKAADHGGFYVVEYQLSTEAGAAISVPTLQQCRRSALTVERYVLGASSPDHRRRETVDGFYDRSHFARAVVGRVVGIYRPEHVS